MTRPRCTGGKAGIPYPHGLAAGTKLSHAGGLNARSVPNPCLATMELDTGVLAQVEGQQVKNGASTLRSDDDIDVIQVGEQHLAGAEL